MAMPQIGYHARRVSSWGYKRARRVTSWAAKSAAVGAVCLALMTAGLTYLATSTVNTKSAVQQQHLAELQTFISTGAEVDASVTDLVDAIDDKSGASGARKAVRHAISAHAAAALSIEPIVGKKNLEAYDMGVGVLRKLVDQTNDPVSGLRASQARFDVMYNRTQIVAEARKHIYS